MDIFNRDICENQDLSTTISKVYFIYAENEAVFILRRSPNFTLRELKNEIWIRWQEMCQNLGDDSERFNDMLRKVRRYEIQYPSCNST